MGNCLDVGSVSTRTPHGCASYVQTSEWKSNFRLMFLDDSLLSFRYAVGSGHNSTYANSGKTEDERAASKIQQDAALKPCAWLQSPGGDTEAYKAAGCESNAAKAGCAEILDKVECTDDNFYSFDEKRDVCREHAAGTKRCPISAPHMCANPCVDNYEKSKKAYTDKPQFCCGAKPNPGAGAAADT